MLPVVALVGRPNVGKSTLFNFLTRSRDALVADFPGLTRDRQYGFGKVGSVSYIVVDTGFLTGDGQGDPAGSRQVCGGQEQDGSRRRLGRGKRRFLDDASVSRKSVSPTARGRWGLAQSYRRLHRLL